MAATTLVILLSVTFQVYLSRILRRLLCSKLRQPWGLLGAPRLKSSCLWGKLIRAGLGQTGSTSAFSPFR